MGRALSDDLRLRVLKASAAGMSARQSAARFTSALWGSAFPSGQAGSPRRLLQTFIPTRFQFLGDWNYQS